MKNPHLNRIVSKIYSENDRNFLNRVYQTDNDIYLNRLKAIGFNRKEKVLDAGCGYGQWSINLGKLNHHIIAIDSDNNRVQIAKEISKNFKVNNVHFLTGSIANLPFCNNSFNAIFCYSVLYMVNFHFTLKEFYRILKPKGLLYFSTNDFGWYIYNLLNKHNPASDYSPDKISIETLEHSIRFYSENIYEKGKQLVMPQNYVVKLLKNFNYNIMDVAGEGQINKNSNKSGLKSFYNGTYYGFNGVYEILCAKK